MLKVTLPFRVLARVLGTRKSTAVDWVRGGVLQCRPGPDGIELTVEELATGIVQAWLRYRGVAPRSVKKIGLVLLDTWGKWKRQPLKVRESCPLVLLVDFEKGTAYPGWGSVPPVRGLEVFEVGKLGVEVERLVRNKEFDQAPSVDRYQVA